jgi:hypothetical protein
MEEGYGPKAPLRNTASLTLPCRNHKNKGDLKLEGEKAVIKYALDREDIGSDLKEFLKNAVC